MPVPAATETSFRDRLLASRWFWASLLGLLTLIVWSPLLANDFTLDDVVVVALNDRLRTWGIAWEVFFHPYNWAANPGAAGSLDTYRPFELVSYVVDYKLFGLHASGYHLSRLLIHVGVQVLCFLVFLRWLGNVRIAFAVALIGALHPACAEVLRMPSDLFVALFGLASILLACQWYEKTGPWRVLPLGVLILATLVAKESGIVFVLALLAFAELERRRVTPRPPLATLLPLAGTAFVALVAYAGIRLNALGVRSAVSHASLLDLLDAATGVWYFATQAFFVPLNRAPALLNFTIVRPDHALWYVVAAANVMLLAVLIRRGRPLEIVGFMWWLVSLVPPAAVTLTPGVWPGLNRWLYAGSPGLLLTITGLLLPRLRGRRAVASWAVLCVVLTGLSLRAGRVWKNDVTLFSAMVEESPDHFWSYRRLGWALYYRGHFSAAIPALRECAKLAPEGERDSCMGLQAAALAGAGDCDGAVQLYRSHKPAPMMTVGHFLVMAGSCYQKQGNVERALALFHACGTEDPRCAVAAERLVRLGASVPPEPYR